MQKKEFYNYMKDLLESNNFCKTVEASIALKENGGVSQEVIKKITDTGIKKSYKLERVTLKGTDFNLYVLTTENIRTEKQTRKIYKTYPRILKKYQGA